MATNRLQSWELVQAIKLEDQPHIKTHHRMAYALRDLGRFKEANDVSSIKHPHRIVTPCELTRQDTQTIYAARCNAVQSHAALSVDNTAYCGTALHGFCK